MLSSLYACPNDATDVFNFSSLFISDLTAVECLMYLSVIVHSSSPYLSLTNMWIALA